MVGTYGQGGFPLARTLAPQAAGPARIGAFMRKSQIDTSNETIVDSTLDARMRERAEQFFRAQRDASRL